MRYVTFGTKIGAPRSGGIIAMGAHNRLRHGRCHGTAPVSRSIGTASRYRAIHSAPVDSTLSRTRQDGQHVLRTSHQQRRTMAAPASRLCCTKCAKLRKASELAAGGHALRKAGLDLGVNVLGLGADSETDVNGQIAILANAAASTPPAIVIAPAQFAALGKPIDDAAKKAKIIGIDSDAESAAFTSLLRTDHLQAGRLAADILADRIKRTYADAEGDVAIITSPGIASLDQRAKGFIDQIKTKYGALDIVSHKVGDGKANAGYTMMMELIAGYPELRGVFASDLVTGKGAAQAVAEKKTNAGGDTINLVCFDSDNSLVQFLQDGTIAALVVQDPFRMGYDGIKTALAASRGEQAPNNIDTGANIITKANLDSARSQELLNPKIN